MKIYYWSPFINYVATTNAVINSIKSINKYSKEKFKIIQRFCSRIFTFFFIAVSIILSEICKKNFHRVKKLYWNKPFQRAKIFQQAYLADMIQELVDIGVKVHCVIIERGWKEIDTAGDYQKALQEFKQ